MDCIMGFVFPFIGECLSFFNRIVCDFSENSPEMGC